MAVLTPLSSHSAGDTWVIQIFSFIVQSLFPQNELRLLSIQEMHEVGASAYHRRKFWHLQNEGSVNISVSFLRIFLSTRISLFIGYFCTFFHLILLIFLNLFNYYSNFLFFMQISPLSSLPQLLIHCWINANSKFSPRWLATTESQTRDQGRRHVMEGRACWRN